MLPLGTGHVDVSGHGELASAEEKGLICVKQNWRKMMEVAVLGRLYIH